MLNEQMIEISDSNFEEIYNKIIESIHNNKIKENNIVKVIISNYYLICKNHKYRENLIRMNDLLIINIFEENENMNNCTYDDFKIIYFFYLLINENENTIKQYLKEIIQKEENINYFEYIKIYKKIKKNFSHGMDIIVI